MIIAFDVVGEAVPKDERMAKSEKFRLDIRRKQIEEKFKSVRKEFAHSLKSLSFLEELKSERDNSNIQKINWILDGLSNGLNNASFYEEVTNLKLEPYFCELILNNELDIDQKGRILRSLVELLYFNYEMSKELYNGTNFTNLLDYLSDTLTNLDIEDEVKCRFAESTFHLVQNLLFFENEDFANFMIESDILKTFHQFINSKDESLAYDFRVNLLVIYKNLFNVKIDLKFVAKTLKIIMQDEKFYNKEEVIRETLRCFKIIMSEPEFWNDDEINEKGEIDFCLIAMAINMKDNFSAPCFSLFCSLLSEILTVDNESAEASVTFILLELWSENFFFHGLKSIKQMEDTSTNRLYICEIIKMVSRVDNLKLSEFLFTSLLQEDEFIEMVLIKEIVTHPKFSKYLIRLFNMMLAENISIVDALETHGILDAAYDSLNNEFCLEDKFEVIELVDRLIWAEEELRDKTQGDNKIVNSFHDKGVIRDIEALQENNNHSLAKRAEEFMKKLSEVKREEN